MSLGIESIDGLPAPDQNELSQTASGFELEDLLGGEPVDRRAGDTTDDSRAGEKLIASGLIGILALYCIGAY